MPEKLIRLDMSRDAGVHPGLVERAFRKSSWATYRERTSKENALAAVVEKANKEAAQEAACQAFDAMIAKRPGKPPGASGATPRVATVPKENTEQKSKP